MLSERDGLAVAIELRGAGRMRRLQNRARVYVLLKIDAAIR